MTDEDEAPKQLKNDLMESKLSSDHATVDEEYSKNDTVTATPEPISDIYFTERYQPVEEPWLLQSPLLSCVSEDKMGSDISESSEPLQDEKKKLDDTGKLSQEMSKLILNDSISTMILINSSICTMQRIAVLEEGQLVELLLEPVKTNVQCDSVYLGVVTKLVPHMGGAFVNIGGSRPSLMDIKQNREPFIFPPFRQGTTRAEVNGSLVEAIEEHLAAYGNNHTSPDTEVADDLSGVVSQEDTGQSVHDDYEENDTEDELDVSEIFPDNVNGNIVCNGEVEADYEYNIDSEHQLGEETSISSFANINVSGNSQISDLQHMKDSGHGVTEKNKWAQVQKGTKIIVQVVKEGLGTKGPTLTAYPKLRSRFWVCFTQLIIKSYSLGFV